MGEKMNNVNWDKSQPLYSMIMDSANTLAGDYTASDFIIAIARVYVSVVRNMEAHHPERTAEFRADAADFINKMLNDENIKPITEH